MRVLEIKAAAFDEVLNKNQDVVRDKSHLTKRTRPDTRLPQSRAGGQGPKLRSLDHLGRSSEVKK